MRRRPSRRAKGPIGPSMRTQTEIPGFGEGARRLDCPRAASYCGPFPLPVKTYRLTRQNSSVALAGSKPGYERVDGSVGTQRSIWRSTTDLGRAPCGGAGLRPARPARVHWSTNQVNANPPKILRRKTAPRPSRRAARMDRERGAPRPSLLINLRASLRRKRPLPAKRSPHPQRSLVRAKPCPPTPTSFRRSRISKPSRSCCSKRTSSPSIPKPTASITTSTRSACCRSQRARSAG